MTRRLLTGEAWTVLEMDVRGILTEHGVPGEFWLVHDLLVAFRIALEAEDLVRMGSVQEHFRLFPVKLPGGGAMRPLDPGSSLITGDRPPPG